MNYLIVGLIAVIVILFVLYVRETILHKVTKKLLKNTKDKLRMWELVS